MHLRSLIEQRITLHTIEPSVLDLPSFTGDMVDQLRAYARESKKRKPSDLSGDNDSDTLNVKESSSNIESDPNDKEKTKYSMKFSLLIKVKIARKEKNKEHAKLARDRKKLYIEKLKESIVFFEDLNSKMVASLRANNVMLQTTTSTQFSNSSYNIHLHGETNSDPLDYI